MTVKKRKYVRKPKVEKEVEKPTPEKVDAAKLQFPKFKIGEATGILRNRVRNIEQVLKNENKK